ncbi:MAG: chaperone modulator CbpM [Bacteroidales bacterium]
MQSGNLISTTEFCVAHRIDIAFIVSLKQKGMISLEGDFIHLDQLAELERLVCFHYDLDINLEGIETINHLLQRIQTMQEELQRVKNRLRNYENEKAIIDYSPPIILLKR